MKRNFLAVFALWIGLLASLPTVAHHSFAPFDTEHVVHISGTVTQFEWTNPHAYIHVDVKGDKGVEKWAAELTGLAMLVRAGWSRDSVKPGDQITVHGHRAKDGRTFMVIRSVMLGDGRELKNGALPPGSFK